MDPLIIVFGLGVGMLVGLTGMGGGSLMTPILIIVFGYNPVTAVGTDLAYGAVTKTLGGWRHFRQRTVFFPLAIWMGVGSVPAAVGGVYVLHLLRGPLREVVRQRDADRRRRGGHVHGRGGSEPRAVHAAA